MYKTTLKKWYSNHIKHKTANSTGKKVYLFCDEFTNYNDTEIGIKAILFLEKSGYEVVIPEHMESGRTWLSKGLIREAKKISRRNIELLSPVISEKTPLVGIEPSAILTFRDEYIDLADDDIFDKAKALAKNVFYIDEFLAAEMAAGKIDKALFKDDVKNILVQGHCHQKSLSNINATLKALSFIPNSKVTLIPSGCCGMAGSFGYEKEHYDLSMQIGELVLMPALRKAPEDTIVAAPGTSCRHQIKDGVAKKSFHPVEILHDALK